MQFACLDTFVNLTALHPVASISLGFSSMHCSLVLLLNKTTFKSYYIYVFCFDLLSECLPHHVRSDKIFYVEPDKHTFLERSNWSISFSPLSNYSSWESLLLIALFFITHLPSLQLLVHEVFSSSGSHLKKKMVMQ